LSVEAARVEEEIRFAAHDITEELSFFPGGARPALSFFGPHMGVTRGKDLRGVAPRPGTQETADVRVHQCAAEI